MHDSSAASEANEVRNCFVLHRWSRPPYHSWNPKPGSPWKPLEPDARKPGSGEKTLRDLKKAEYHSGIARSLFLVVAAFAGALGSGGGLAQGQENASNPLAAVSSTDPRLQYFDLGESDQTEAWIDGAYMATPKLKLRYEVHYVSTNVTGSSEADWESFHFKPIYFPKKGTFGNWNYTWAVGLEWIVTFDHTDRGIGCGKPPPGDFQCRPMPGSGSDQIAPLAALSLVKGGLVVVPLVQHFVEYDGQEVNQTAVRLIAIQSLPNALWTKLDAIVPFDWENDLIPATFEIQLGRMMTPAFGLYFDALFGIGSDRPYDWGLGVGLRFSY